ncbi:ComEC/Rec2 family competence protein [Ureaplasma ceti]|uniref:ComEC/Rec2 family competence protein n=1 Tax=Ureaplasma ceti TaxID=3119530 RepID=UPI00333FA210
MIHLELYKYKLTWFQLLTVFCTVILFSVSITEKNYWFLIITTPFYVCLIFLKTSVFQWLNIGILIGISLLIIYFIPPLSLKFLNQFLEKKTQFFYLRKILMIFIESRYSSDSASFIEMLLFNFRNQNSYQLLRQINSLNIGYLFVVSGFHISLLLNLISRIFCLKKRPFFRDFCGFCFTVIYGYFLGYSIGILRICLNLLFRVLFRVKDNIILNCWSGLIIGFCFNQELNNLGYLMTFLCSIYINFLMKYLSGHKFALSMLISLGCFFITLPMVLKISPKINVYFLLLNYLYSALIPFIYSYLLLTFYLPRFNVWNTQIITGIIRLIHMNLAVSSFVYFSKISNYYSVLYYFALEAVFFPIFFWKEKKLQKNYKNNIN